MAPVLDITPLRSLVAVSACGGFHRAAHALHLTQAAVSRHVQRLEDAIGRPLIERDGRGIRFTPDGEEFLVHARAILDAHDTALARFDRHRPRTITVGSMDHAADELLPDLIHELRRAFPERDIQFRIGRSAQLRASVARQQLDVAIVLEGITRDPHDPHAIACRWLAAADWRPPEAALLPLVLFDHQCGLRTGALDTLAAERIGHHITAEAPDLTGVHAAARAGLGVTLLPVIGRIPDKLTVVPGLPAPPSVIFGIRTSPALDTKDAEKINEVARRAVRDLLRPSRSAPSPEWSRCRRG
ncbi:LysR family transcriptional regulator [Actinomadura rupiterrae]|uniref:LysR family transcriptional regulator n=1 Tax=Actinomadura rupiterrae TaxID=559627 RepID=UPI0020A39637|nr:LysR family transcriptional regulator [Actinomadura rupiterrae]MCP2339254.1 DNA-binding transcriptional LysR family regulator [Actinomadura rupiterrae]